MRAGPWDNGLVDQKEGQMKPVEATERGQSGHGRTPVIRRDGACGKVFPAGIDPGLGFGPPRGVYGPMEAAPGRIEAPTH